MTGILNKILLFFIGNEIIPGEEGEIVDADELTAGSDAEGDVTGQLAAAVLVVLL